MKTLPLCIACIAAGVLFLTTGAGAGDTGFSPYVDKQGDISRPTDYRASWSHLGSWIVPDQKADSHGFHDVYTQEGTVETFRETGKFPDGAVLVKEIRKVESSGMTTGETSWAGDMVLWFVMIKDQKGRFPDDPNWGNGWGWALFKADQPAKNVSTDYEKDCLGCHYPAQDTDWVYVEGYPSLR